MVIILIFCVFIYGLYLMNNIDKFLYENSSRCFNKKIDVLIYGNSQVARKIRECLDEENISYENMISDISKQVENKYNYLFVLSDDDLDNLMMCAVGKKWLNINNIISICNDIENKKIFDNFGVVNVDSEYGSSDEFLSFIKEKVYNV